MRRYWLHYRGWAFSHSMLFSSHGGMERETGALHSTNSFTVSVSYYSSHTRGNQMVELSGKGLQLQEKLILWEKKKRILCKPLSREILPKTRETVKMSMSICKGRSEVQKTRKIPSGLTSNLVLMGKVSWALPFPSQPQPCLFLWFKIQFSTSQMGNMISSLLYRFLWFTLPYNKYITKYYLPLSTAFE